MSFLIERLANWITHHTKAVVITALLLLIPSLFGYLGTKVNYDILSYLPDDLDSVQGQQVLDETFHNAASCMLIIEDMPAKDVAKLKDQISQLDGVTATWISDLIGAEIPKEILPDVVKNVFFSSKTDSTMMIVQFTTSSTSEETMDAIDEVRALAGKQCFLSGMSALSKDTMDLVNSEVPLYVGLAVLLALVAMILTMKSWLLPFVFLGGIGLAVVYNFGTNIIFGQISYITQAIAAILQLGVTMDYSIFLIDRYEEEKLRFPDRREAMAHAITRTFTSLSGSSMTTIFGFIALCFMRLALGRDIGLVMAKGVVLGVLTVVIILPALILLFDKPIHRWEHRSFVPKFDRMNRFVIKHRKVMTVAFFLLFIPAIFAQSHAPMYYNLDKALPQDMPSIVGINKMKENFDMATTHFVIVDDTLPSRELAQMTTDLQELDGISSVLALNTFIGPAINDDFIPDSIKEICAKDGKQMMMINSSYSAASDAEKAQLEQMNAIIKAHDPTGMITGEGALTNDLITIADNDFKVTSVISIVAIFLIIAICFKSITVPIITVGAIELAIFINQGIPFFTGTAVPFISPIVIGCVQLGATVDYAILLTTRFREEMRGGKDRFTAMRIAANASNRSIFTSALVLFCATFGVYLVSNVEIIKSICAMLARGSVISALIIMFLLTPVLVTFQKVIQKTSIGWMRLNAAESAAAGDGIPLAAADETLAEKKRSRFGKKEKSGHRRDTNE